MPATIIAAIAVLAGVVSSIGHSPSRARIVSSSSINFSRSSAHVRCPMMRAAIAHNRVRRMRHFRLMLYAENDTEGQLRATAFQQALQKLGWVIGRDVQIDIQWDYGDVDWLRSAAAQLLRLAPDLILANGSGGEDDATDADCRARAP
jgi:hypothetical protein